MWVTVAVRSACGGWLMCVTHVLLLQLLDIRSWVRLAANGASHCGVWRPLACSLSKITAVC
ncbi:hypothetical protein PR003_g4224 [Phytophthora rubi]|uniref:Uncharacterized protein n=1 Tax=Phytophthora rubi TaxID=129364 RepID=A0A6A3P5V9_9STRA|nr:hypothetical protein PR002_g4275 [Phytophthora rubi]KAE9048276.1 hypothetical protein PR001_g3878 [Phytophthora rubi]KAE9352730.1 hypothetical protein PR003_g4224 [Phytophthora rubi]